MSASVKDIYKEILNSKSRFLTIMLIVFLGALTYVGMNTTVDVMNNTADTISKKYNWCEIECVEDNKIKSIERINDEIFSKIEELIK